MDVRKPDIEDVSRHYDNMTDFYHIMWGESLHLGYWPDPAVDLDIEAAQECFTDLMIRHMPLQPGQRMLDVGCGTGQPAVRLAQATGGSVVGITINRMQVERANARAQAAGVSDRVRFEFANAMELPYADASFNAVWAFESLFHMPDRAQVLREMARVVRPGGRFLIADLVEADIEEEVLMSDAHRALFFSTFEMNVLPTPAQYRQVLQESSFAVADVIDITPNTFNTLRKSITMLEQQQKHDQLRKVYDQAMIDALPALFRQIRDIYETHIRYLVLSGTRR
ncbi:MAG: SAM-dependent methyltransferase [Chloroflexaceae bacterium]